MSVATDAGTINLGIETRPRLEGGHDGETDTSKGKHGESCGEKLGRDTRPSYPHQEPHNQLGQLTAERNKQVLDQREHGHELAKKKKNVSAPSLGAA